MDKETLLVIKDRVNAASPGPWVNEYEGPGIVAENPYGKGPVMVGQAHGWGLLVRKPSTDDEKWNGQGFSSDEADDIIKRNGDFMAAARQDMVDLINEIESLWGV